MAFTTPKTWASGALSAAEMNEQIRDNVAWLKAALAAHGITSDSVAQPLTGARYGVSLTVSSDNVPDATDRAVQLDTEEWDDAAFHSAINPARITIPTGGGGTYAVTGFASFEANGSGRRELWIEKNGATAYNRVRITTTSSSAQTAFTTACEIELVAGDFIVLRARQSSGSSLAVEARFQARRVAI